MAEATPPPEISSRDRLIGTLFFAALLHGILILGIGFRNLPSAPDQSQKLEVTLVRGTPTAPPEQPQFWAQIDQQGAGEAGPVQRPRGDLPDSNTQMAYEGIPQGSDAVNELGGEGASDPNTTQNTPTQRATRQVLTTTAPSADPMASAPQTAATPDGQRLRVSRLVLEATETSPALLPDPEAHTQTPGAPLREMRIAVNTRSHLYAPYLYQWRLRIEAVGNLNMPDEITRQGLFGDVTLEVAIRSDGRLEEARVVVPSPHRRLDQAALRILQLAAPFEPFSDPMKQQTERIRFVWKWRFLPGEGGAPEAEGGVYVGQ
ncbi:MAG: TonB family protein [Candidatus Macondimonas sp.]